MKRKPRVFVLLEHGRGINTWTSRYGRDEVADATPYGYGAATSLGLGVEFSVDKQEGPIGQLARRGLARLLGFDIVHVLRNVSAVRGSDVVWTHTEYTHLAYTFVRLFARDLPPAICNTIWLGDSLQLMNPLRRQFLRFLLKRGAKNITESPENVAPISDLVGSTDVEFVAYGLDAPHLAPSSQPPTALDPNVLRILALGNDRHRDWPFFLELAASLPDTFEVKVASRAKSLQAEPNRIQLTQPNKVAEMRELYSWADVVCIPLRPNTHASGVTVAMEATAAGKPFVATNVGGIAAYFPQSSAYMCSSPNDITEWQGALERLRHKDDRERRVALARSDVKTHDLTRDGYLLRLHRVSLDLLARR